MKRKAPRAKKIRYDESPPMESSTLQETPLSMLELRQNAAEIMDGLKRGLRYRLSYRGKTIASIVPVTESGEGISPDDAIFHLEDYASDGPVGHLTNEEIDRAVYGY